MIPIRDTIPSSRVPVVNYALIAANLGLRFLLQFLSGAVSLGRAAATGGVAWRAHAGGFVAGIVFLKVFSIRRRGGHDRLALDTPASFGINENSIHRRFSRFPGTL